MQPVFLPVLAWCALDPEKLKKLAMTEKERRKIEQMHYGWYVQATSALLGAMGKEMYMKMNRNERKAFVACLDGIDKENDLQMGAQCLVKAFDGELVSSFPHVLYSPQYDFVGKEYPELSKARKRNRKKNKALMNRAVHSSMNQNASKPQSIASKISRDLLARSTATKSSIQEALPPTSTVKPSQNSFRRHNTRMRPYLNLRKVVSPWTGQQNRIDRRRYRRNVLSLYSNKEAQLEAKRVDRMERPFRIRNSDRVPNLIEEKRKSPVKMITDILTGVVRDIRNQTVQEQQALHVSFKRLEELQKEVVKNKNRKEFKHRMLDMVLGENHPLRRKKTFSDRFRDLSPEMSEMGVGATKLVDSIEKHTKTLNYNMLSPRFLPLLPDKYTANGQRPILSPNLFPMYKDDSENSVLPLPDVLEKSGLQEEDRDAILELVMDASGVNDIVTDALRLVRNLKSANLDKDVFAMTSMVDDLFENMKKSLNRQQKREMKQRKYSFLTTEQLKKMYGENGVYNTTLQDLPFDIEAYGKLSYEQKEEGLKRTIRLMANGTLGSVERQRTRSKRAIIIELGPFTINHFNHITLSPFSFSPTVNTMNILGAVTLSPSIFSPSIVGPLLLSPPVLSPSVGNPLIFTPYVLGPNVLSAAVFAVYVFSPYVLAPNVINPYVMSPLILSPYVLCPDVISPTVLSGAILSPSVLSPSIFTESALAANVLSPTFLS